MELPQYPTYVIYEDGRIWSKKRNIFLKPYYRGKPGHQYACVDVFSNGKRNTRDVHKLVALCYIPNPNNYSEINHKDCNRLNNHISNLEWCTHMQNCQSKNQTKPFGSIHLDRIFLF